MQTSSLLVTGEFLSANKVRVVLVQVPPKEIIEEYDKPRFGFPTIGLAYIVGYLRSKQRDCVLIDARYSGTKSANLIRKVCATKPNIVGFSAMTHQIEYVAEAAAKLRNVLKNDVLFVLGGTHATALPRETLRQYPVFDVAVVSEGADPVKLGLITPEDKEHAYLWCLDSEKLYTEGRKLISMCRRPK